MKLGIVFEGGASRTLFSCGVADVFLEEGIMPDYFIGVSAGIAYGISYLSGQKGRNLQLAKEYMAKKEYQGFRYMFDKNKRTYYNLEYVFKEIPQKLLPFDYEAFAAFPGEVMATVTNIHTGKAEYMPVPRDESHYDLLVASCALPLFFRPIRLGNEYYLDGGIADSIPYKQAIKAGCDKIIVVLTRERSYVKTIEYRATASTLLYRNCPNIKKTMRNRPAQYNAATQDLLRREKRGEIFVIAPDDMHGVGRMETDPDKLTQLYEEGCLKAKEQMTALKNYLYS